MSNADLHDRTGRGPGDHAGSVPGLPRPLDRRPGTDDVLPLAPVDQSAEIPQSFLRRQPGRIVEGRFEGGYTDAFEVICYGCGDNPHLDYSEVSPRLQRIRGPYTMHEGFAAYKEHLAGCCRPFRREPVR
jgi:hypothetical protein